jgi:thiamine biosynthesis protein ThiS
MKILFNDREYSVPEKIMLADALDMLMQSKNYFGMAVAVNMNIISKELWKGYELKDRDVLLVIKATQGG